MRLRTWAAGCAALLALAGCASADPPAPQPATLGELSAAYLDAGGACDDLVEQYRASDDEPAVATCTAVDGSETVLTVAVDADQAQRLRTASLLRDEPVLAAATWLIQDPDLASLQETLGGELVALAPADGPANLADALVVDEDGVVAQDPVPVDGAPEPVEGDGVEITVVVDPACEYCARFDAANREQLAALAADGEATIAYVPVALGDTIENGSASSLGVNALACAADADPDAVLPLLQAMLDEHASLDQERILELGDAAVEGVADCVAAGTFAWWTRQATERALQEPLPDGTPLRGVPSIFVDDRLYAGDVGDAAAFAAFVAEG